MAGYPRVVLLVGLVLTSMVFQQVRCEQLEEDNHIESNQVEQVSGILPSIYDTCLPKLSFTCLQKKVLVFVDRLDRVEVVDLAEGWSMVKRRGRSLEPSSPPITEEDLASVGEGRAANSENTENILHDMLDNRIVSFFDHRVLRFTVPPELATVVTGRSGPSIMEVGLNEDASEGRLKKKKKLKLKVLLMGALLLGGMKLIKLMPVFLALIKLKAIKAIILAAISLFITLGGAARGLIQRKLALFSSPMKHVKTVEVWLAPMKGGHGGSHDAHGSYSSGGNSYHGGDSYSPSYSSGGGDSYSSGHGGSYSDSYSNSYSSGGGGGWASKSDSTATPDAHNLAYRAHTN